MPNSRQSSDSGSPASRRATNFILSSITEHSFQGIAPSPLRGESVTYVSGTMCYLCLRPLIPDLIRFTRLLTTTLLGCNWVQHRTLRQGFQPAVRSPVPH